MTCGAVTGAKILTRNRRPSSKTAYCDRTSSRGPGGTSKSLRGGEALPARISETIMVVAPSCPVPRKYSLFPSWLHSGCVPPVTDTLNLISGPGNDLTYTSFLFDSSEKYATDLPLGEKRPPLSLNVV